MWPFARTRDGSVRGYRFRPTRTAVALEPVSATLEALWLLLAGLAEVTEAPWKAAFEKRPLTQLGEASAPRAGPGRHARVFQLPWCSRAAQALRWRPAGRCYARYSCSYRTERSGAGAEGRSVTGLVTGALAPAGRTV